MKSILLPGRPFFVALLASSALTLTLAGCIESPDTFDTNSVATASSDSSGSHDHSSGTAADTTHDHSGGTGTTDTTHDHSGGTGTTDTTGSTGSTGSDGSTGSTGGSDASGGTAQNPTTDFLSGQWLAPATIANLTGLPSDSMISSPEIRTDNAGNQIATLVLSSNLDPTSQVYTSKMTSVLVKQSGAAQWIASAPFADAEKSIITDFQIKTDATSGKTYALWQKMTGEVFISEFTASATTPIWQQPEQILNPATKNILIINSHGMPSIIGVNSLVDGFQLTYRQKMHDGNWANDLAYLRGDSTNLVTLYEYAVVLDSSDKPVFVWAEGNANGRELWSINLDANNTWVPAKISSVVAANGIDLTHLKKINIVLSATNTNKELILTIDNGSVYSVPYMSMDGGANFMWHTPTVLLDSTTTPVSMMPQVVSNGEHSLLLWGEHNMANTTVSTASTSTPVTDTSTTATDTTTHVHKVAAREMVMASTNTLKSRSFSITEGWGAVQQVGTASNGKLIKYVTPVLSSEGFESVSWIEADSSLQQLFVSHSVSHVWSTKEYVQQITAGSMQITTPAVNIDEAGKVHALWAHEMLDQTGLKSIGLMSADSINMIHMAHDHAGDTGGNTNAGNAGDTTNTGGTGNTGSTDNTGGTGNTGNTGTTVSATWSIPQTIWTGNTDTTTSVQFRGPDVAVDATGHSMIYMEKTPEFDVNTNSFGSGNYMFHRQVEGDVWNMQEPPAPANAPNAKLIRYHVIKSTGEVYALWSDSLNIYFSRYVPSVNQWLPAENMNVSTVKPYLLVNETGMATLIWTSLDSVNNTLLVNAKHFMPSSGWMGEQSTSIELTAIPLDPVVSDAGVVTFPWLTRAAAHAGTDVAGVHADLWTAEFDPASGWSTHTQGAHVPEFAGVVTKLYNLSSDMKVAAFYNFINKSLSASVYMKGMGWSDAVNLGANTGQAIHELPIVSVNSNGVAMIAWLQSMSDSNGVVSQHYMSSTYSMAAGWSAASAIAPSGSGSDSELDLVLDSAGHAIATWVTSTPIMNMVHVNHYDIATGWSAVPEMLAGYENAKLERAVHPSVDINLNGQAVITWDHVMQMNTTEMHHIQAVKNF